ncbi:kinase-like protein [Hygrophoropsis aurantiaca]|uniref:Kinase-like protein n=1 Tax=Hygrophoropsis aurantiaca TaxID=72124 RepID=A0ACB8A8Y7_9AGAM|nr:kinase-like protein [Hygrophoropsis aurantiaca]
MSLLWSSRKTRLAALLNVHGDEGEEGIALDRILHGQNVIGKTARTTEIDSLRFADKDLSIMGTLEHGQFGVIHVVSCHIDKRVYVRKSMEKSFALRNRDQCFPQFERDLLLKAHQYDSAWAPHLLCAYQTPTHLNLVMDYAEGGSLWDVLESSPLDGRVSEEDIKWWTPQLVCAIHWCHSQGFAHRDIKPHNFVLTPTGHVLLTDFGSAAPLLSPQPDGGQFISKQYTLVPCGTCDYISPEVLQAHEEALLALEMSADPVAATSNHESSPYGLEIDWWSLGAMLYEMAFGVTPFFAKDIRTTYLRIMDHETSLRFNRAIPLSNSFLDFLRQLLCNRDRRIGRRNVMEITEHPFFENTNWSTVDTQNLPRDLHMPHFITSDLEAQSPIPLNDSINESRSQPFAFSALFQSSVNSTPGLSILRSTSLSSSLSSQSETAFIGFSWGPSVEAFSAAEAAERQNHSPEWADRPSRTSVVHTTPHALLKPTIATPAPRNTFATPTRFNHLTPYHTLPRPSTVQRTAQRRAVSDREAMKQLVDCIGMSARKKVLASGRKPRILDTLTRSRSGSIKKELRFGPPPIVTDKTYNSVDFPMIAMTSASEVAEETDSEGPPSPSPSPRPGSAMSMLSRRSTTPTISGSYSTRLLNLPSTTDSVTASRENGYESPWDEQAFHNLEDRFATIMADLSNISERLDYLQARIRDSHNK